MTKCRSDARFTLGMRRASRLGAFRTEVRSSRARPVEMAFIRTPSSVMLGGRAWVRKRWRCWRAEVLSEGGTESSRS